MIAPSLGLLALFLSLAQASPPLHPQTASPAADATANSAPAAQGQKADCNGANCEEQQPHIVVTLPQQSPAPWLLRDRIELGAQLALLLFGYFSLLVALAALRKIERGTRAAEETAQAALEAAQAALKSAESVANAERPWLLIGVEPSLENKNSFIVTATNRGRTPASIVSSVHAIAIAAGEASLPAAPVYTVDQDAPPHVPAILVPGESAPIKTFGRDEVQAVCASAERFKRVEAWSERIYLHGKIVYRDLIAPPERESHTTHWCCWYIHGRQKSGMVMAGPPAYNAHS